MTLSPSFLSSYRYGDRGYDFSYKFSKLNEDEPFSFIRTRAHYILCRNGQSRSLLHKLYRPLMFGTKRVVSKKTSTRQLVPEGVLLDELYVLLMFGFFRKLGVPDDVTSRLLPDLFDFARSVEDKNRPTQILLSLYVRTVQREGETTQGVRARMITEGTFCNESEHPVSFDSEAKSITDNCDWLSQYDLDVEHCSICLQGKIPGKKSTGTRLPCSHVYHAGCILGWMVKNQTCPLCRAPAVPTWLPRFLSSVSRAIRNYYMQPTEENLQIVRVEAERRG